MDGGGERKGFVGMVGNEGIVVGMEEGSGGSATFGSVRMVGSVGFGRDGSVGRVGNGVVGRPGIAGKGGNVGLGRDGI